MSPEQAMGERDIGPQADVWSMGVLLFRTLSGTMPFRASRPGAVLAKIMTTNAPPLKERAPDLPDEICAAIDKALLRDTESRHRDMGAFFSVLVSAARAAGVLSDESDDLVERRRMMNRATFESEAMKVVPGPVPKVVPVSAAPVEATLIDSEITKSARPSHPASLPNTGDDAIPTTLRSGAVPPTHRGASSRHDEDDDDAVTIDEPVTLRRSEGAPSAVERAVVVRDTDRDGVPGQAIEPAQAIQPQRLPAPSAEVPPRRAPDVSPPAEKGSGLIWGLLLFALLAFVAIAVGVGLAIVVAGT